MVLTRGAAERGRKEYARLQEEIRASPVVYGDETGWCQDGSNGYLWSVSISKVRYFLYRSNRGRQAVEGVLGDDFEGVLVSDFYGAYNVYEELHQRCWTSPVAAGGRLICGTSTNWRSGSPNMSAWPNGPRKCGKCTTTPKPDPGLPETVRRSRRVKQQLRFPAAAMVHLPALPGQRRSHEGVVPEGRSFLPELFTLVAKPRTAAVNNAAERSLRPPEDQRQDPLGPGKRDQGHHGFFVRDFAFVRTQPLPCSEFHPLPTPTCAGLNSYQDTNRLFCVRR